MRLAPLLRPFAVAALFFAVPPAALEGANLDESASLSVKQLKGWDIVLPADAWRRVGDTIQLSGFENDFVVERAGVLKIEVDTNGDGKVDAAVKGTGGELLLRGRDADGKRVSYPVRFRSEGTNWFYACGGTASGKLAGIPVRFIDQNGDGTWNEVGVDAMTVGASRGASYLSSVVNLDGSLYELEVTADGTGATVRPWQGESGWLDMRAGFQSNGELISAVVRSGDRSFNVAGKGSLRVPAGEYDFVYGFAARGEETVEIGHGRMVPLVVRPGGQRSIEWGGPISAEVSFTRTGAEVTVAADLKYFGTGGEEYTRFAPEAKSPKILVKHAETGGLLDSGRFAGC